MEAGSLGPASCTIPLPAVPSDLNGPGISYPRGLALALRRAVYGQFHTLGAASYCEPLSLRFEGQTTQEDKLDRAFAVLCAMYGASLKARVTQLET